jgi:enoyl-CoA hydratase/carnithine racemase
MAKQTLNLVEELSLRDGYRYEQDMTAAISKTEDAKEAQLAFREKRAPTLGAAEGGSVVLEEAPPALPLH